MSDNIKVSVLMPAYNSSKFIREAIESVLIQDFKEFELVIVDDGSQDKTWEILKEYSNHKKVRIYRNKTNLGVGATRNRLINLARGKYITPVDSDDVILPGILGKLSKSLDLAPKYGAVCVDMLVLELDNKKEFPSPYLLSSKESKAWDILKNPLSHAGSMIRRNLLLKIGGYDEELYSKEDWDMWLKLSEITKIKFLSGQVYYIWRRRRHSLTRRIKNGSADRLRVQRNAIMRRYGKKLEI